MSEQYKHKTISNSNEVILALNKLLEAHEIVSISIHNEFVPLTPNDDGYNELVYQENTSGNKTIVIETKPKEEQK
jgi:hypothetical protein